MTKPRWFGWPRLLDALVVCVIAFVAWKVFVAPRALDLRSAKPAPQVRYALLDGGEFVLAQQRGRLVFLDFWASWCIPCKAELPLVERYARTHPNVDVVPVDVGEPRSVVAVFAARHRLRNVALDPASSSQGYFSVEGFPTIVVVDPQGRIRATWSGFNPAIEAAMSHAEKTLASN